jgi:hypothetical protein
MDTKLTLYELTEIEMAMEELAERQDGELTDEQIKALVDAQTQSIEKVTGLVKTIRKMEMFEEAATIEIERIKAMKDFCKKRREKMEEFLTPFVVLHKKVTAGTFRLSTRESTQTVVPDGFNDPYYCKVASIKNPSEETVAAALDAHDEVVWQPDKAAIKQALQAGEEIEGCSLLKKHNLQIK